MQEKIEKSPAGRNDGNCFFYCCTAKWWAKELEKTACENFELCTSGDKSRSSETELNSLRSWQAGIFFFPLTGASHCLRVVEMALIWRNNLLLVMLGVCVLALSVMKKVTREIRTLMRG